MIEGMVERRIAVDGQGVADFELTVRTEEMTPLIVVDSGGEARQTSVVELDEARFAHGVIICPQEYGVLLMDPANEETENRALNQKCAYYMDLMGRIMEITTGYYVTGPRYTFGFNVDILERFANTQKSGTV